MHTIQNRPVSALSRMVGEVLERESEMFQWWGRLLDDRLGK